MNHMFYSCGSLTSLNSGNWDVSKVTTMSHMFAYCHSVEVIDVSGWKPSSCVDFDGTFNDCWSLKELDTTGWDTGSAVTLTQMFEGCRDLKTIKGIENWDVSKVVSVNEMFYTNGQSMAIEELDLSGWNTASLTNTGRMFMGCGMLTTVYVGDGWNLSQVTGSGSMFTWCGKLIGGKGTTVANMKTDDATYACADGGVDAPGYLTYKAAQKTD
jgi:surface protein